MKKEKKKSGLVAAAIVLYLMCVGTLYKGYDKMNNYTDSYPYTNYYVGGDAYNYIINGNYSTGFFVLSMGFGCMGTVFLAAYEIINSIPEQVRESKTEEVPAAEELPEI